MAEVELAGGHITLANGVLMPRIGLGTYKAQGEQVRQAVSWALEAGYRHIDTASIYKNEVQIGEALRASGLQREKVFITSKASPSEHGYQKGIAACNNTLQRLGVEYVDQYLIHWPGVAKQRPTSVKNRAIRKETWRALEDLHREGKCRSIGVSNYTEAHLEEMLSECSVRPMINQVEVHPYLTQDSLRSFCCQQQIQVVAYASLGCGQLLQDGTVLDAAHELQKTPAQVLLQWGLQHNLVVIPKSVTQSRVRENFGVSGWSLSSAQMTAFDMLNKNTHFCWSPEGIR